MGIQKQVQTFPLVHIGIGIFGNATFLVGSVLFLWDATEIVGVWLFIVGALGMLLGSVGELILRRGREQAPRHS